MHWNVPPDALPGSATLVRVLDRWLNDWYVPFNGTICIYTYASQITYVEVMHIIIHVQVYVHRLLQFRVESGIHFHFSQELHVKHVYNIYSGQSDCCIGGVLF